MKFNSIFFKAISSFIGLLIPFYSFIEVPKYFSVITLIILIIYNINILKLNLINPNIWFLSFCGLYHYSLVYLEIVGFSINYSLVTIKSNRYMLTVGLFIFIFNILSIILTKERLILVPRNAEKMNIQKYFSLKKTWLFLLLCVLIYNFYYLFFIRVSKTEAFLMGLQRFDLLNTLLAIAFSYYVFYSKSKKNQIIGFALLLGLFISLNTGFRGLFINFLITSLMILYFYGKIKIYFISIILVLGIIMFSFLSDFRNVFTGANNIGSSENLLVKILSNDPMSAATNLDNILIYLENNNSRGVETFLFDIASGFILKSILYIENSENWYNNTFFPEVVEIGGGMGFSLLASFLLPIGFFGFILISVVFSLSLIFYYNYCVKKDLIPLFIVSVLPISYSLRSDMATLIGFFTRSAIVYFIILWLYSRFEKKELHRANARKAQV